MSKIKAFISALLNKHKKIKNKQFIASLVATEFTRVIVYTYFVPCGQQRHTEDTVEWNFRLKSTLPTFELRIQINIMNGLHS